MEFHIISLFPKAFDSYLGESILKRAIEDKKLKVSFYNPRDFANNKWSRIDRPPYAGGPGMVIQAEPVVKAIEAAKKKIGNKKYKIIFLSPSGKQFTNEYAKKVAKTYKHIIIVSGRYEGIDARVKKVFKVEDISIGPFVLTGGELPAEIIIDVVSRQVPGILGNFGSLEESRTTSPDVYTRPEVFRYKGKNYKVPKVLLSGNRAKIELWRKKRAGK
ncbi:tRNA (guanosine(37)-N1)-methyltransferase TrmD [Candidatus Parcubacteria bacterium]|nr:tRNA (guanosine(37)-N1)-methyltransferase TrmD [Candidatus Parcubacteria bacterium]